MGTIKKLKRMIGYLLPSPIQIDFEKGGVRFIQSVAPYPKEVFWDDTVPIHTSPEGVRYVRTPDERFEDLPGLPFSANYVEIDGLRMHFFL